MRGLVMYLAGGAHRHQHAPARHAHPKSPARPLARRMVAVSALILGLLVVLVALPTPPGA